MSSNPKAILVAKGGQQTNLKVDVNQTLAAFRIALTPRGLMTASDAFFKKDNPIVDEEGFTVEEALNEGVLTIANKGEKKLTAILVTKGGDKTNLKVDVNQTLAAFRIALTTRGLMTASDAFLNKDNPIVDEEGFTVGEALNEGVLTIANKGEKKLTAILVTKGGDKTNLKVDVNQTLAAFRIVLTARGLIEDSDAFFRKNDPVTDEEGFTVGEAVNQEVLTIGARPATSSRWT